MIKNKILSVMGDTFLDLEYIAFKAQINSYTAVIALMELASEFVVIKNQGRYMPVV